MTHGGQHNAIDFPACFRALTGWPPLKWQCRLFGRFAAADIPATCTLPTGLGKTSVIPIWLIALAHAKPNALPRRLVYIVNRRTVVDQATAAAERIRDVVVGEHEGEVCSLRDALGTLSGEPAVLPLAISTLRGEFADNGEWKRNPARPAIIVGTIDMIGSKLLFSGYGDGRYGRAHHAGLVGQDTLIVHDEAHLSPAFSRLLWSIELEQRRAKESRPIQVLELSATSRHDDETAAIRDEVWELRAAGADAQQTFKLEAQDDHDAIVVQRRTATKTLSIQPCPAGRAELAKAIAARALSYRDHPSRVLVYVRSPKDVKAIADAIKSMKTGLGEGADERVCLLTGTIRGFERDRMARENPVFRDFLSKRQWSPPARTIYLIATSAGEVGVDLDADHVVCDLTTLDSMAQRFGRVNRLGGPGRSAEITVVCEEAKGSEGNGKKPKQPSPLDVAIARTGEVLRGIESEGADVSPGALSKVLAAGAMATAFSPPPTILPATDILFDAWALTSIPGDLPGRPDVGPYLHGVADWEPPETHLAWRAEIGELDRAGVGRDDLDEMLEEFPLRSAEELKDSTRRVINELARIAERHPQARAILIRKGEAEWMALGQLAPADKNAQDGASRRLEYVTLILPTDVGGLQDGVLNGGYESAVADVAEARVEGQPDRQRVRVTGEEERPLLEPEAAPSLTDRCTRLTLTVGDPEAPDDGAQRPTIEYRVAKAESGDPGCRIELDPHNDAVSVEARRFAMALGLPPDLCAALILAGKWHDSGKARGVWQTYARNYGYKGQGGPVPAIAKAARYLGWKTLNGYRHEFGSLLGAAADGGIKAERDLVLHLIAAHHGWARPHFNHEERPGGRSAYDPDRMVDCPAAAADAMRRYASLQRRFGRWGLAWLESLLRAADAAASEGGAE